MALWSKWSTVYSNGTWDNVIKRMTENTLAVEIDYGQVHAGKISKSRD